MNRAMIAVNKVHENYDMVLYLVKCKNETDLSLVSVPRLPYIIVREETGVWSLYSESMVVTVFVRAIQTHGRYEYTSYCFVLYHFFFFFI